ncbi:hypothetical protein [Clostridium scatologenes]|nr:hypothetical protein [Clostridium scatologenes]
MEDILFNFSTSAVTSSIAAFYSSVIAETCSEDAERVSDTCAASSISISS